MEELTFEKVGPRCYKVLLGRRDVALIVKGETYTKDWCLIVPGWWDHPMFDTLSEAKWFAARVGRNEW